MAWPFKWRLWLATPECWLLPRRAAFVPGERYAEMISKGRDVSVRQHEDGENHRSFALPGGCDRQEMRGVMREALPLIAARRPELLLYQAGADPYYEDPYSPLGLDHDDLRARDRFVFEFARAQGIPIAWVLAGGYTEDVMKVVRVHLNTFEAWRSVYGG